MTLRKDPVEDHDIATADKLVEAAIEIMRANGEPALRTEDVLAATGLSVGTMYHNFGSRDGLVDAAVLVDYRRTTESYTDMIRDVLAGSSPGDGEALLDALVRIVRHPGQRPLQERRLALLGLAVQRPALLDDIAAVNGTLAAPLVKAIADAQAAGVVRRDLDAHAIAAFMLGYTVGRVAIDLGPEPVPVDDWAAVVTKFARSMLVDNDADGRWTPSMPAEPAAPATPGVVVPPTAGATGDGEGGSAADRLIEAAIAVIVERGETCLRTQDVLEATGLSVGTLYHHFGSRNGLIEAAVLTAFRRILSEDIATIGAALGASPATDRIEEHLGRITRASQDPSRGPWKRLRIALVGSAMQRPSLRAAVAEVQNEMLDALAEVYRAAQREGVGRHGLDPRALAVFTLAYSIGQVHADIGPATVSFEDWVRVIDVFIHALLVDEDPEDDGD